MNIACSLRSREFGRSCIYDYILALKRLRCFPHDEYHGITPNLEQRDFNPDPPVFACEFSSVSGSQHLLALANEDGKIAMQDINILSDRKQIEGFQAHSNAIFDISWVPGDMKFVTVSGDSTAILWDVQDGNSFAAIASFHAHTKSVKTVAFSSENKDIFATGARDGVIMLWDTRIHNSGNQTRPDNAISNSHVPSVSASSKSRKTSRGASSDASSVTSLVFQDNYNLISCGAGDGYIKVWDLRKSYSSYRRDPLPKHRLSKTKRGDCKGYTCLVLDRTRQFLYASCTDSTIYSFNVATYQELPIGMFTGHQNSSYYVKACLSPDGRYLLSGSGDLRAYLWDTTSIPTSSRRYPDLCLTGHGGEVTSVAWCPVGGDVRLVTCSDDGWHRLWKVSEERDDEEIDLQNKPCGEAVNCTIEAIDDCAGPSTPATPATPATPTPTSRTPATPRSVLQLTPHSERSWRQVMERTPDGACPTVRGCQNCRGDPSIPCTRCRPLSYSGTSKKRLEALWEVNEEVLSPSDCKECKIALLGRTSTSHSTRKASETPHRGARRLFSPTKASTSTSNNDLLGITPMSDVDGPSTESVDTSRPSVLVCTHRRMSVLSSPTLNLPNYVLDGTSPHHTCSRDARNQKENVDWLTKLRKERNSVEKKKEVSSPVTPSSKRSTEKKRPRAREGSAEPVSSGSSNRPSKMRSNENLFKFFRVEGKPDGNKEAGGSGSNSLVC